MQKRKFNKAPKVSKFDTNELSNMVFDSIFDMEHTRPSSHKPSKFPTKCLGV